MNTKPIFRCAIYTRKSSEEGLEQEFNSLEAQREACMAYIASQKHEGWQAVKMHYDDGGFSGGNMERPALKRLLEDIDAGKVNVVVVYKVDRLTRSLADFVRIIERFEKRGVSFVSVTQQFNTTSSMGRLTLNVLLSFAQFEREVTGERIRDKIAASKKKGIWMGGNVPLGYDVENRKLLVNHKEAETVRYIYRRYLELGAVRLLKIDLNRKGIRSKVRGDKGGLPFLRGMLYWTLSNPLYIGQIRHKGACHPGQHEAIIDQELWEKVQQLMASNSAEYKKRSPNIIAYPLMSKLFDVSGERLVSSRANKKGRHYRYYISQSLRSDPRDASSSGWRLPAQEIEQVVAHAALDILHDEVAITAALQKSGIAAQNISSVMNAGEKLQPDTADLISRFVRRVEVRKDGICVTLSLAPLMTPEMNSGGVTITRDIPMLMKRRGIEMRLVIGGTGPPRVDQTLLKAIVRAHRWFDDLASGRVHSIAEIAAREGVDKRYVYRVMNLAFLAPDITESIVAGRQPADFSVKKLTKVIDLPPDWTGQRKLLGFA